MEFHDKRDDKHPIRWTSKGSDPDAYLSVEDAVRRIARDQIDPDAEVIQAGLMRGLRYQTSFAFYEYEDPS